MNFVKDVSDINNNNNNIFAEYFKTKEMIDVFHEKLPKCTELEVILTKNLKDKKIKLYENLELKYYFHKDQECIQEINKLYSNKLKLDFNYDKTTLDTIKENNKIKKILIKKGFY